MADDIIVDDKKQQIIDYVRFRLGDGMVDVDLDKEHYDTAIKQALLRYRQRAEHAEEESYAFLDLTTEVQEYILPKEIKVVRQVFRRGIGSSTGTTASQFEPFQAGYLNTYMLIAGRVGGLVNYELFAGYQKLAATMFGGYINFTFNPATHKLTIVRKIPGEGETVVLWVYNEKPDNALLADHRIFTWVQDYAYALAKHMLGEAREKFGNIVGPQGGFQMNGTALKAEAKDEMEKLIDDLTKYVDGSTPMWFITG